MRSGGDREIEALAGITKNIATWIRYDVDGCPDVKNILKRLKS